MLHLGADVSVTFVADQKLRHGTQHLLRCSNVKVCCQLSQVAEMMLPMTPHQKR
jgi:hypothetical protein